MNMSHARVLQTHMEITSFFLEGRKGRKGGRERERAGKREREVATSSMVSERMERA